MRSTTVRASFRIMLAAIMGFFLCFSAISSPSFAGTPFGVSISGDSNGINEFNLSIGEYYQVPEREVFVVHERGISEEELPVVFFIAQRAHVYPEEVVDLRLSGMSWMDITLHLGLSPEIFYVPVVIDRYRPPYGHAYGYYQQHPRGGWGRNDLRDKDIVNQVNLKFISEHHGYDPEKVMRYRSEGRSFTAIDHDINKERPGKARYQNQNGTNRNDYRQTQNMPKPNVTRQGQYTQNMPRTNMTKQGQYTQSIPKPNVTRQDQYTQNMPKPNVTKQSQNMPRTNMARQGLYTQNMPRTNVTRQDQYTQNMPKPNVTKQSQYMQNMPRTNVSKQNQNTQNIPKPNENKQNQHVRDGSKQHEYVQIENHK